MSNCFESIATSVAALGALTTPRGAITRTRIVIEFLAELIRADSQYKEFSRRTGPLSLPLVHMKSTSRYKLGPRSTPHHPSP